MMFDLACPLFPPAFPALAAAHFVALLSPGPDFFLILGHSVRHHWRGSLFICVGIAAGNAGYIALAISGWAGMKQSPWLFRGMELAGAAFLVWLGMRLLHSGWKQVQASRAPKTAPKASPETSPVALGPLAQFLSGLGSAWLNPKNGVFYLALMTSIIGPGAALRQQVAAGAWMVTAVLVWDIGLAVGVSHPRVQKMLQAYIPRLELLAGLMLMAIAAWLLLEPFLAVAAE